MAPQDSKIAVEILQSVHNRTQSLREIAYYAWLLLTYIVINTLLGRMTRHPAGMHCPARDDAFVSSTVYNYTNSLPTFTLNAANFTIILWFVRLPPLSRIRSTKAL